MKNRIFTTIYLLQGDQASIIGGAIDFIKELEQMLLSFQAEKSNRSSPSPCEDGWSPAAATLSGFFVSPQYTGYSCGLRRGDEEGESEVDVEATAMQGHVNLKVAGRRRPGQLVKAIAAMEELRLTVLHLSITSLNGVSVLYSLNLKVRSPIFFLFNYLFQNRYEDSIFNWFSLISI